MCCPCSSYELSVSSVQRGFMFSTQPPVIEKAQLFEVPAVLSRALTTWIETVTCCNKKTLWVLKWSCKVRMWCVTKLPGQLENRHGAVIADVCLIHSWYISPSDRALVHRAFLLWQNWLAGHSGALWRSTRETTRCCEWHKVDRHNRGRCVWTQ